MNKPRLILIFVLLGTLLLFGSIPAAASPPSDVSGHLEYIPSIVGERFAGGNTFWDTTEVADWFGAFDGSSTDIGKVVIHTSGAWSYKAIASFEGNVDGKSGTLEISLLGKRPDATSEWQGKWVILSGTGELSNLHGQGTWWGLGFAPPPRVTPLCPAGLISGEESTSTQINLAFWSCKIRVESTS